MDQNSVDALLAQIQNDANTIAATAQPEDGPVMEAAATALSKMAGGVAGAHEAALKSTPAPSAAASSAAVMEEGTLPIRKDLHRLLAIEVPIIVQLGKKRMNVGEIMRLGVGAIIEFGKSADEELDLLSNNKAIGKGQAVKVGENFGIKISAVGPVKETIRKLGAM